MVVETKVLMIGGGGVGKSSITIRFIQNEFTDVYDPTIEDSYRKQVEVDNEQYILDILDTAGQEEFATTRDSYMRTGEGFILIYTIVASVSFEHIPILYEQILRAKEKDQVPCILVGNKNDLESDRQVSKEEGENLAKSHGWPFYETSAKTSVNCTEIFHRMIREIRDFKRKDPSYGSGNNSPRKKKSVCLLL